MHVKFYMEVNHKHVYTIYMKVFFFFFFCILEVTNMATVKNFHLFISDIFNVIGIYTTENYTEK
jgi:hypothetical protein